MLLVGKRTKLANYHVLKNPKGGWNYKKAGASRASGTERTQAQAEKQAKRLASVSGGGEVRIHGENGKIRDSDTVKPARDPFPPKDKVH